MAACRSVVFFSRQLPQLRRAVVRGCRRQATVACSAGTTPAEKARVVVLTGPTGVGKTAASLRLARALGAEIISADSVQVFAGLDIGSDKLPVEQREGVPHHLIDILPPDAEFSAGDFYDRGRQAREDILKRAVLQRGKVPLVVGGTSFYLQWFIYGKADTPKSTPQGEAAARAWLDTECAALAGELGRECTRDEVFDCGVAMVRGAGDEASAQRLEESRNNFYRLMRVLEIIRVTGAPLPRLEADPSKLDYDFRSCCASAWFGCGRRRRTSSRGDVVSGQSRLSAVPASDAAQRLFGASRRERLGTRRWQLFSALCGGGCPGFRAAVCPSLGCCSHFRCAGGLPLREACDYAAPSRDSARII